MNDYLLSVLLGIVEGLTEFLPVSSTAHLRIVEALFKLDLHDSFWKMYTIVIQLGAILALPVYFRERIVKLLASFPGGERGDRTLLTHPLSLTIIAFVITAIPSWLLKKQIGQNLESLTVMAWALLIGGVVMWVVDAFFTRPRTSKMDEMNVMQAAWIGAAQILSAVFPGTSRSMSTIAAGQTVGLSRPAALELSFFCRCNDVCCDRLRSAKTIKPSQHDQATAAIAPLAMNAHGWGRARGRVRRILCGCVRCGRVVHALGESPRLRSICGSIELCSPLGCCCSSPETGFRSSWRR